MITSGKGQHLQLSHCLLLLCLSRCLPVVRFRPILCPSTMWGGGAGRPRAGPPARGGGGGGGGGVGIGR